jgi:hypothetical protein
MKVHIVLEPQAKRVIRGQSAASLDDAAQALLQRLQDAGLTDLNLPRALRHGIVTGCLADDRQLARFRKLPEVHSIEPDGAVQALR